jgi:hypothetical protein
MQNMIIVLTTVFVCAIAFGFIRKRELKKLTKTTVGKIEEKQPTRNSIYADHVINTAARIYCNYSESKIIRPGMQAQQKEQRYKEALSEAFTLVNKAYFVFDDLDKEGNEVVN